MNAATDVRIVLGPVIAASAHWLARAYPSTNTAADRAASALHGWQASQAVTVAIALRCPTPTDAHLLVLAGPGGSELLDWRTGSEPSDPMAEDEGWRTWVDEVAVSWAACLLGDPGLAERALQATADRVLRRRGSDEFRRLVQPNPRELAATAMLRHPDLLEPLAGLHRSALLELLPGDGPRCG